jgi:cell volume regulation protein A
VSGAIAALVFGLVLSNKDEIARILKIKTGLVFDDHIKQFHSEVSFVVRTFFFVYLGLIFTLSFSTWSYEPQLPFNMELPAIIVDTPMFLFILVLLIAFLGIFLVRYLAATVTVTLDKEVKPDKSYLYSMLPRGLAAAVIAALPFTIPEFLERVNYTSPDPTQWTPYYTTMYIHEELFLNMAFMMIVLSVIATTIGISLIERKRQKMVEEELDAKSKSDEWIDKSRTYRKHVETSSKKEWKPFSRVRKPKRPKSQVIREHPLPPPPKKGEPLPVKKTKTPPPPPKREGTHPLLKRVKKAKSGGPGPETKGKRKQK